MSVNESLFTYIPYVSLHLYFQVSLAARMSFNVLMVSVLVLARDVIETSTVWISLTKRGVNVLLMSSLVLRENVWSRENFVMA
jgi:hypothetical protein